MMVVIWLGTDDFAVLITAIATLVMDQVMSTTKSATALFTGVRLFTLVYEHMSLELI